MYVCVAQHKEEETRERYLHAHLVLRAGASKEVTHSVGNHRRRRDDAVRRPIKRRLEKPDDDDDDDEEEEE